MVTNASSRATKVAIALSAALLCGGILADDVAVVSGGGTNGTDVAVLGAPLSGGPALPRFSTVVANPADALVVLGVTSPGSGYDVVSADFSEEGVSPSDDWSLVGSGAASQEEAFFYDAMPGLGVSRLYFVTASGVPSETDRANGRLSGDASRQQLRSLLPDQAEPGLRAEFRLTTDDLVDIPDFAALEPFAVAVTSTVAYADGSWPAAVEQRGDYFACRITGFVLVPVSGLYTFYVTSDDGSRLVVDGTRVVYSPGAHGAFEKSGSVMLEAGWRPLELAYYENAGSAVLSLAWKGPGFSKQAIPADSLCHVPENLAPVVALAISQGPYVEGQEIVLSASVRDVDGEIASAYLYDGDTLLSSVAGQSYSLAVPAISPGVHSFRVVATDSQGASSERTVEISVEPLPTAYASGLVSAYYAFTTPLFQMPDVSGVTPVGTGLVKRIHFPLSAGLWEGMPEGLTNRYAAVYSGALMVREPGVYTITLRSDDGSLLLLDGATAVDNGGSHSIRKVSASVTLSAGLHELRLEYFENIGDAGLELSWTRPDGVSEIIPPACLFHAVGAVDSDGDGMPDWWEEKFALDPADPSDAALDPDGDGYDNLAEFHAGTNPRSPDTDADGMPDAWELANGTVAFVNDALADPDGDGLVNVEEMRYGTNPLAADTDGDGISDYDESRQLGTDPTSADSVTAGTSIVVVPGSDGRSASFTSETPQAYMVTVGMLDSWRDYGHIKHPPCATTRTVFRVDGRYVAFRDVPFDCSNLVQTVFYTPVLPSGDHVVSVEWCNPDFRARTESAFVHVNAVSGTDFADIVRRRNSIPEDSFESRVSPAFIEGSAVFPWLASSDAGEVKPGVGDSWYLDIPLSPTGQVSAAVLFEGMVSTNITVGWTETDLFAGVEDVSLRVGDSLLFSGGPAQVSDGTVEVLTNGVSACSYAVGESAALMFVGPGECSVRAFWHAAEGSGIEQSGDMSVTCVGGTFPRTSPSCVVGAWRQWQCSGLQPGVTVQTDVYTHMELAEGGICGLLIDDTRGERRIAARVGEGGPVLDVATAKPMWATASFGNVAYLIESGDDFDRCRCHLRQYGAEGTVSFRIRSYSSSVLMNDYSTEKTLWIGAFDGDGIAWYDLLKSKSMASPCHTVSVYQDGMKIGEAVYGNGSLPMELR